MSMKPATAPSALRVQEALGSGFQVLEFEASTKTAADAAAAVGTTVAQIAKSMIFRTVETDRSVLVVTSGSERVDEARVSAVLGEEIGRASAASSANAPDLRSVAFPQLHTLFRRSC
jgi:prolyl-tRNA editing enzyme YbaK/EbsC (Cys-tRNA(Pro) deacylase)